MKASKLAAICASSLLASAIVANAADSDLPAGRDIELPAPKTSGGMSLMDAISARKSGRAFADRQLSGDTLSTLLWATAGYNRPAQKMRTAGSTRNLQAVSLFVMTKDGIYLYDASANKLACVVEGDRRDLAGMQAFAKTAPVTLLFVGDKGKLQVPDTEKQSLFFGADIGLMSQNAYLVCAQEGLATVIRGSVDGAALGKLIPLGENQAVMMAQSVGYPAD